jgi:hypothetical protein
LELLDQAYLLGGQLWPEDRAWLMLELIYAASEMRHPSLEKWVNELMQGSMAQADFLLYQLIPLIREYSPGAAEEIAEKRPSLKEPLESGEVAVHPGDIEFIGIRGGENPAAVSGLQNRGLERSRLQNVQALAASDPDAAVQMSGAITDPALRARALAGIARRIQKNDPARAEGLMKEASELLESVRAELDRLNIIVHLARGYPASDHPELWNSLKRGLELGEELFERDIRLFPGTPAFNARGSDEVTELTQIACEKEADNALQWLSAQHSPLLKSNLLISAARGFWAAQQH